MLIQSPARTLPALIWAALVPIKLIAVVFLPSAFAADWVSEQTDWKRLLRSYAPAVIVAVMSVGGVVGFNLFTTKTWTGGQSSTSLAVLASGMRSCIFSIPRQFLFSWYGTAVSPLLMIAFFVCMILATICLCSLRPTPSGRWFRNYGTSCLLCSALLLFVSSYDPSARLTGYGLIILLMGFRPLKWANGVWMLYGASSVVIAIVNGVTVNALGSNDPRYAELALQFRSYYNSKEIVATNSFHILDIHANISSIPVTDYKQADHYDKFFWVTLPQFDAVATSVTEMPHPGKEWCEERRFSGGVLFTRCNGP